MRVLHFHLWCDFSLNTQVSGLLSLGSKSTAYKAILIALLLMPMVSTSANSPDFPIVMACDNVVTGGTIAGNEFGCPNPTWDPSNITSVSLPTGGTGTLEYLWIYTTSDPNSPVSLWTPIPGSNSPDYNPGPITVNTYFRRCAKRSGCTEYVGESNIILKEAICCDNVTNGGTIAASQVACQAPLNPAVLTNVTLPSGGSNALEYQWVISTTGTPYTATNADWTLVAGATGESYDPPTVSQTTYFIRLSRRHGCTDYAGISNMVTIAISDNLAATAVQDAVTCFGGNDGAISLTPSGGTSPYTYTWSGSVGTAQNPQNLLAGTYTVTVTDANGCTTTSSATVQNGAQIALTATATAEACNGADNGSATVTAPTGGTSPYVLAWNTTPAQSASQISNLAPGTYTVTATDALGCTASATATVAVGPPIAVDLLSTNVLCFGKNTGSASIFSVANGSGIYSYTWNTTPAQTTTSISNLLAGSYTVTVSDNQGCTGSATATIADGPQIFANPSAVNATCNYSTDGSASVAVTGGVAPYSYVWNDPNTQTTATASNLAAGTYAVTITDANGCTSTAAQTVQAPIAADLAVSSTNVSCFNGSNGTATVTITNGNPASYNYLWSNAAAATTATVTGLTAGNYGVTVSDNNGCLVTESVTITQPTQLNISMSSSPATCGNGSDGSATVSVTGGTPFANGSYNYQWSANNGPNVNVLDDVSPGSYSVTVTDANGCSAVGTTIIAAPPVLSANLNISNITCNGLANGQISVTAAGGVPSYSYAWANGATGASISNLVPGNYSVVVTDAVGCSAFANGTVTQPAVLAVATQKFDVICVNDTDGSAIALPIGGTAPYNYTWSNGQTTANISNLGVGNYTVTVSDANGCMASSSAQIISTTTLALSTTKVDANCFNSNDGSATAVVAGGSTPFVYAWSNAVFTSNNPNLTAGTYSVTVSDADGCVVNSSAIVAAPSLLVGAASIVSPITTYGGNNGSVKVTPTGGVAPYTQVWDNGSTASTLTSLSAGNYYVTTTDAHGCTAIGSVTLTNPSKLGDFVWHDLNQNGIQEGGEPGLANVKLFLIGATSTGVQVNINTLSGTDGSFHFDGLAAGNYRLKVELPAIHVFSPMNIGSDFTDSDINPADSFSAFITLPVGQYYSHWDVGLIELDEKINIGDFVFQDADHDGVQDLQEQGIANFTVRLYSMPGNTLVATKTTNAAGKYLFTDVLPGLYQVEFLLANLPNGQIYTAQNIGSDDNLDSDPNPATGRTATFQVFPFTVDNLTIDAGVYKECDNITDGGLIGYNETLCGIGADPAEIVSLALPTGGFGVLEYLWLKSTVPVYNGPGDPNWSPIANSNSPNYNPGNINQTTYYIRCARRAGCNDYPGESNIVSKSLTANPLAQIIDAPLQICHNAGARYEAAIAGGGATYLWSFGDGAVPATATTRVVNGVSWTIAGSKTISLTVTRFGCSVTVTTYTQVNLCGDPLIVIFDDVMAELEGEQASIRWRMAGGFEPSSTVFFVQRSEDGSEFENLNAVAGTTHDANGMFQYVDDQLRLGENIYRIVCRQNGAVEPDGYSPTASVFYKPAGVQAIQVYPNPTFGKVTVEFVKQSTNASTIQVWNAYGHVMFETEVAAMTERAELDMSKFATGVYWMRIVSENVREQVVKIVKSE